MTGTVLVLNAGSSSLKYQLLDPADGTRLADGIADTGGDARSEAPELGIVRIRAAAGMDFVRRRKPSAGHLERWDDDTMGTREHRDVLRGRRSRDE